MGSGSFALASFGEVNGEVSSISMHPPHLNNSQPSVASQQLRPNTQHRQVTPEDNGGPDWKQLGGTGQAAGYVDKKSLNILKVVTFVYTLWFLPRFSLN